VAGKYIFDAAMQKQEYTIPSGQLFHTPFHLDGKDILVSSLFDANNVSTAIKLFSLEENDFKVIDSSRNNNICTGFGDVEGNGNINFFGRYFGIVELYGQGNNSFFGRSVDKVGGESAREALVGIGLVDIDNCGVSEMLFRDNFGNFFVRKKVNNAFQNVLNFNYYTILGLQNIWSSNFISANVGNYYGDGKKYFSVLSTNLAFLTIFDISGSEAKVKEVLPLENHFHNELYHKTHNLNQVIYSVSADIDGDGIDELIYMFYGKINDTTDIVGKYEL